MTNTELGGGDAVLRVAVLEQQVGALEAEKAGRQQAVPSEEYDKVVRELTALQFSNAVAVMSGPPDQAVPHKKQRHQPYAGPKSSPHLEGPVIDRLSFDELMKIVCEIAEVDCEIGGEAHQDSLADWEMRLSRLLEDARLVAPDNTPQAEQGVEAVAYIQHLPALEHQPIKPYEDALNGYVIPLYTSPPATAVYQCPRCSTSMQIDEEAKPAPAAPDVAGLVEALRQYQHNDGSDGFVFGYDKGAIDRYVAGLLAAAPAPAERVDESSFEQYRLAAEFAEQRGVVEKSTNRAIVVDAFATGYGFGITAKPAPAAPDVAVLLDAMQSIYDEDYQAPHDATDFDVSESRKQCIYRIRRKVKDALANFHREG